MGGIEYFRGSLFDDTKADTFGHACNCQNVWGAGVAKQFQERFLLACGYHPDNVRDVFKEE